MHWERRSGQHGEHFANRLGPSSLRGVRARSMHDPPPRRAISPTTPSREIMTVWFLLSGGASSAGRPPPPQAGRSQTEGLHFPALPERTTHAIGYHQSRGLHSGLSEAGTPSTCARHKHRTSLERRGFFLLISESKLEGDTRMLISLIWAVPAQSVRRGLMSCWEFGFFFMEAA